MFRLFCPWQARSDEEKLERKEASKQLKLEFHRTALRLAANKEYLAHLDECQARRVFKRKIQRDDLQIWLMNYFSPRRKEMQTRIRVHDRKLGLTSVMTYSARAALLWEYPA